MQNMFFIYKFIIYKIIIYKTYTKDILFDKTYTWKDLHMNGK